MQAILQVPTYARGRFVSQANFVVSLLAATIGLGDVLRFPAFVLKQNESSLFIPFLLVMTVIGIPLVSMELFLGQFTSSGPATCWEFAPIFRGVGFASLILSALANTFYQVNLGIAAIYIFDSVTIILPWKHCDRQWASDMCLDYLNVSSANYCRDQGWNVSRDGACYNDTVTPKQIKSIWNTSLAAENKIKRVLPAADYFNRFVQGVNKPGISLHNLGSVNLRLFGCLVLVWTAIGLTLAWGLNSLVRVLYIAILYTFFSLILHLLYDLTLDGALSGIKLFFSFNLKELRNKTLWLRAANQAIFTLSVNSGALLTLASFNNLRGDCCLFATMLAAGNVGTSILSGCIAFAVLGSVSTKLHIPFHEVSKGDNIGFVVYPYALAQLKEGSIWSGIFFFMIFIVGLSSATVYTQAVYTGLLDLFPLLRHHKTVVLVVMCSVSCLLGIPLVTDGGPHLVKILGDGVFSFDIFVLSFMQVISLAWVYGVRNFLYDVSFMVGENVLGCVPWRFLKYGFVLSWTVLSPVFAAINAVANLHIAFSAADTLQGAMKLTISCIILLPIPICAVRALLDTKGSCLQKLSSACQPTEHWGPALLKDRTAWLAGRQGVELPASKPKMASSQTDIMKDAAGSIPNVGGKMSMTQEDIFSKQPSGTAPLFGIASLSTVDDVQIVIEPPSASFVHNSASGMVPLPQTDPQENPEDSMTDDPRVFPKKAFSNQHTAGHPAPPASSPSPGKGHSKSYHLVRGALFDPALSQSQSSSSLRNLPKHLFQQVQQRFTFRGFRKSSHMMANTASIKSDNVDSIASLKLDIVDNTASLKSDNMDDTASIKSDNMDDTASIKSDNV